MALLTSLLIGTAGAGLTALAKGFGCDVGPSFSGQFLTEFFAEIGKHLPGWVHEKFQRRPGEPNHDLAAAFHAALQKQIAYLHDGSLESAFTKARPADWNTLHTPTRQAIEAWFASLRRAATDTSAAGAAPVVPLNDPTLKALLEEAGSDSPARRQAAQALRADLEKTLTATHSGRDPQITAAIDAFLDWLVSHLGAQFQIFLLEEMKHPGSRAWVSYQFLVAQTLQENQKKLLEHAGAAQKQLTDIIALLKQGFEKGSDAFPDVPKQLLEQLKQDLAEGFNRIYSQLDVLFAFLSEFRQENRQDHQTTHASLADINQQLVEMRAQFAAQGKTVADFSQDELELELASRLGTSVTALRQVIAAGLASTDSSDRATALLASGRYEEAEQVSLQAAAEKRQHLDRLAESAARDYRLAGNACSSRNDFRAALPHYREALRLSSREQFPELWAALQNDLAVALWQLGIRVLPQEGNQCLGEAVTAYRAALEVRTRESLPQDWAATQNNLGNALGDQAERLEGAAVVEILEEAVAAYRAALEVRTRESLPQDWAMTQNNLGAALSDQAGRMEGAAAVERLEEAAAAYRAALEVRTRESLPQDWAMTQNNLGVALRDQAGRMEGAAAAERLEEADAAYRAALEVYTRESLPQDWAMTQNNLGNALRAQAGRMEGAAAVEKLEEAAAAYLGALEVYTKDAMPWHHGVVSRNLDRLREQLGE